MTFLGRALRAVPSPSDAEDEEISRLVDELRAGAFDGAARAYDRWHQRVRVLARRLLGDSASAEDVVQEVFVALPSAARRFRGGAPAFEAFVLGIAVKRARRHQRAAARRRRACERLAGENAHAPRTPEQDAYRRELGERLSSALAELSHDHRAAFVLCEIEGLAAAEAALVVGAPEATVRTRLFHARRRLRELLSGEGAP
ncbi:MAG TPA: RNA polymerase sigma factor [Polyangia bacterium]|nr:RNA polymerase sigma factor [Polyangia bacterium]